MEKSRPQLNLSELHQLKWLLGGVLAFIAAWTVVYMDVDAWILLALITLAVPLVTMKPGLIALIPRWAHRLAFPTLVAVFATDIATHWKEPLPAIIRLALMLIFYRVITLRKRRDDLQLIVLGLFLVVVGGVLSVSILFAAQIVVFTAFALMFLLAITLADAMEQGSPPPATAEAAPPVWMHAGWRRLARRLRECVDWRVAVFGCVLFGGVVGLSVVLFMAIPRFELGNNLFLDRLIMRHTKTGFSENIQFGDIVDIQNDTSVALSVDVSDRSQVPAELYWRMLVLDEYAQGSFHMSAALRNSMTRGSNATTQVQGDARFQPDMPVWTFYMEAGTSRFLPLLGGFNQISFDGAQDASFSSELGLVLLRVTPSKMLAYRVEGMQSDAALKLPEAIQSRNFFPEDGLKQPSFVDLDIGYKEKEKLAAWVTEIGAPPDNPSEFARRASEWLSRHHSYSLQSQIDAGATDPVVRWIASAQPGHCELFAGAFTLLARTAGYPTRVVLGFKGGTWNARSKNITVRNSEAHAWCEIFDRASGSWTRVDPTPGSVSAGELKNAPRGEAVLARIRDDSWQARFESLRVFWYRRIVNFDQKSQVELAHNTKKLVDDRLRALKAMMRERLDAFKAWIASPWDFGRVAGWSVLAAVIVGTGFGWKLFGRGWWLRWRSGRTGGRTDPVRREAGRWLRRIAECGLKNADLAGVRAELERLRYGPKARWPEPTGVFRRARRTLKRRGDNIRPL